MRVLDPPAAPSAAAWEGWATRRDWRPGGHEIVGYRQTEDDALAFALVDARQWAGLPAEVAYSVVQINVVAYELHAGRLCTSSECPIGTPLSANAWASAEGVRR